MIYRFLAAVFAVNVHCQYYEWPQQQQQQQPQYNQFNNGYQPFQPQPQFQQPQFQQPQQQYQQFQPQYQQFQPQFQQQFQPVYQPPPQQPPQQPPQTPPPPPIYSQTVIIPQAPPPPPEAYQAQQYAPPQQPAVMVQPADIPRYHQKPVVPDVAFQHVDRARSVSQVDFDNKLFREQTNSFTQNQEKITLLAQPPPPPPPPAQTQPPLIRVPPPPARFIPSLKSLYNVDPPRPKTPAYRPDEIIVDGHRAAYFEDTQRTRPQISKVRVQGGNVHSSSAAIPRVTQQVGQVAAVTPQQQQQRPFVRVGENSSSQPARVVRPPQQTRPAPVRPQTRRPVPQPQPATRPSAPRPVAPPKSHLAPQPAPAAAAPKPRNASEKFLQCCKGRKVNKSCERICSFDVLSKKTLTGMFLGTDPCPQHHGLDLMQCAADSDDHTECCLEKEVDRTSAGRKCLGFCNMKPGITFQADVSMLPCWSVLNDIKQCFKENLERQLAAN